MILKSSDLIFFLLHFLIFSTYLQALTDEDRKEQTSNICQEENNNQKEEKPSKEKKLIENKNEQTSNGHKDEDKKQKKEEQIKLTKENTNEQTSNEAIDENKEQEKVEPPPFGNFSLPASQQPYGLFAFGGNIIDKGEVQFFFFADCFKGKNKLIFDLIPSVVFGVSDIFSISFNFPFTPKLIDGCHQSSGLEDFFIQFEYSFYNKKTFCYVDQATFVGNITVPTGSVKKNPPTGFGSPSFFLGGTYTRMMIKWFVFTAHGAILTTSDHRTKIGDQFLYQFGFGRNIPSPPGWIYAWMVEIDGQYNKKNRIHGHIDPNSGGNTIYVTPSLWTSCKHILVQFGVSFPIYQNLFGKQNKFDYALNFNFAWSYY